MKYVMVAIIALLVPTAAMAKGECKADKQKFCKDVIEAKGDVGGCMDQHAADLSDACKAAREAKAKDKEAKAKEKKAEDSAKMGKEEGTHTEPGHGEPSENDTSKVQQPERRNPTTGTETPKQ